MTQLDPRAPTGAPPPPNGGPDGSPRRETGINWRISAGMFVGLAILFGVLFGLRALHIFPPEPGQDAEIAAARATQAALGTQEALAPRPTVAVGSAPAAATSAVQVRPAATPATAQQSAPTAAPEVQTPVPITVPTTQPVIAAKPAPALEATTAPTVQSSPAEVQAAPTPVQASLPADLAAEIVQGYSNYWTVRAQAQRDPTDTTVDLEAVMADNELIGARKTLAQFIDAGQAFDISVRHQIWITSATADEAMIVDRYTTTTSKLDPATKTPIQANPTVENRTDTFQLRRVGGAWKVVDEPSVGG